MNEIVKKTPETIAVFSKPNALQEAESNLLIAIKNALLNCYFELNQAVPGDFDINVLVNKILDSILEKFTGIRAEEISKAFSNGIRKQYGEYYGLCLISFEQFIEGYLNSPERIEKAKLHYKSLEQKSEPTASEKFTIAKNLTLEVFEKVKSGKPVALNGSTVYEFLNSISLIGPDYKKGVMPRALEEYVQELKFEAVNCMELIKRRYLNQRLELLQQNIEADAITPDQYKECKRVAKRLILTDWMRDHMIEETDLNALIESRRNAI